MSSGKALIIGIDHYHEHPLGGCVKDADSLGALLDRHQNGDRNFDCLYLCSSPDTSITATEIERHIDKLFANPDEVALLHFSGHGARDDKGSHLVAQDGSTYRLSDLLQRINSASPQQIVVTLDCCFSGGLGAAEFVRNGYTLLREGVALLVASRANEPSSETAQGGIFSTLVSSGLDGGAADILGSVTVAGLYAYMDEALGAWDQGPLMKANLTTLTPLRKSEPLVPISTLRRLPEMFPDPDEDFPLDPSYEPDERYPPKNLEHEEVFARLQECNRMRLIDPVGADHMFYAAVNSRACRLTSLGKRYWRMAKDGRL